MDTWVWIVIAVVAVAAIALILWAAARAREKRLEENRAEAVELRRQAEAKTQRSEDRAGQLLDRVRHRRAQPEHLGRVHVVVDRDPGGRARQLLGHQPVRVLTVRPVEHLQAETTERGGERRRPAAPGR